MKKILFLILFLLPLESFAQIPPFSRQYTINANTTTTEVLNITGLGLNYFRINWDFQGNTFPSACTIQLQSSSFQISWANSISSTCTSAGQSTVVQVSTSFLRLNNALFTAASVGNLIVTIDGWITNPTPSGTSPFTLAVNEPGTSTADFTTVGGTWTVVSNAIQVTPPSASNVGLRITTGVAQSACILQADISISSTGTGTASGGLVLDYDGNVTITGGASAANFGPKVMFNTAGSPTTDGQIFTDQPFTQVGGPTFTYHFSFDTFYTLRVVAIGSVVDVYVNGVYIGSFIRQIWSISASAGANPTAPQYFLLLANGAASGRSINFKNILFYNMALP